MDVDGIAAAGTFAAIGRAAVYVPISGPSVQCKAFLARGVSRVGVLGEVTEPADFVEFQVADIPAPERGAMVRFEGAGAWRIDGPPDRKDNGVVAVPVVRCQ